MKKIINIISKISIFSLIGVGLNLVLIYTFLRLWIRPQVSDVEMIINLIVLMIFEFVMVHSGVFMSVLGRSWKAWLGFVVFYGLFALAFNAMVSGNQIIILYGGVVLNRMLPNILRKPKKTDITISGIFEKNGKNTENLEPSKELMMSALYAMIYFFLLFTIVFSSSFIPKFGLTKEFLEVANYSKSDTVGGDFADKPYVFMCFGVLYYLFLTLLEVMLIIHKVKK
jgi:hypothetical protein